MRYGIVQQKIQKSEFNCHLVYVLLLLGRKQQFLPMFEGKLQMQTDQHPKKVCVISVLQTETFSRQWILSSAERKKREKSQRTQFKAQEGQSDFQAKIQSSLRLSHTLNSFCLIPSNKPFAYYKCLVCAIQLTHMNKQNGATYLIYGA